MQREIRGLEDLRHSLAHCTCTNYAVLCTYVYTVDGRGRPPIYGMRSKLNMEGKTARLEFGGRLGSIFVISVWMLG